MTQFRATSAFLLLCLSASGAWANGLILELGSLDEPNRSQLRDQISLAKQQDPSSFAAFAQIKRDLPALQAQSRGGSFAALNSLFRLGQSGFWPMLNELVLDTQAKEGLSEATLDSWRLDLLHALSELEDERADVVFRAIVKDGGDADVVASATAGLSRGCSDEDLAFLLEESVREGRDRLPVLRGLAYCHRREAAERIGDALVNASDPQARIELAEALSMLGSAWAWETPALRATGEGDGVRSSAAGALVVAYVRSSEPVVREFITQALLVVDWPETLALLSPYSRADDVALEDAIEQLVDRFENSPFH